MKKTMQRANITKDSPQFKAICDEMEQYGYHYADHPVAEHSRRCCNPVESTMLEAPRGFGGIYIRTCFNQEIFWVLDVVHIKNSMTADELLFVEPDIVHG